MIGRRAALLAVVALGCALLPRPAVGQSALPGPLVDATWLMANRTRVAVLDVREDGRGYITEGHIPGAILVPWKDVRVTVTEDGVQLKDMLPPPQVFTALMRKSGVDADSRIVIAARGLVAEEMFHATRLYWQIKYYGHDDVAVLDGGTGAWAGEGRRLDKTPSRVPRAGTWIARAGRTEMVADTRFVAAAVASRAPALTDSRRIGDYLGSTRYKERVDGDGHIPGAKPADATLFVQEARPVRFRSVAELRQIAAGLGIDVTGPMITYCDTGDWASATWFVFHELLGNKAVRLYDGSMHAWTRDMGRPRTMYKLE